MPTPPISPAKYRAAHQAVKQFGSVSGAAKALGIPCATLEKQYARALMNGMPEVRHAPKAVGHPTIKGALIERPHIPAGDEDIETYIAKRKEAYRRKRAEHNAKQWMRFGIKEAGPFGLVFVGDPHADDDGADLEALERDLDLMGATPGLYGVGLGDWVNSWTGKLSRLYGKQTTTEKRAFQIAEWMLNRDGWLLLLRGNHDLWHGGASPLLWMRTGAAPLEDWQAKFEIACGNASWRIWAAHNFPGNSMWNTLHGPMRRAQMGLEADVYVCGHLHNFAYMKRQDEHTGKTFIAARARGYKDMDSYARDAGYGTEGEAGRSVVVVFNPATRGMTPFDSVPEAADFLTHLRRKA